MHPIVPIMDFNINGQECLLYTSGTFNCISSGIKFKTNNKEYVIHRSLIIQDIHDKYIRT